MARIGINTGATANDGTGDNLRAGAGIVNDNFLEIYNYLGAGSTTELATPLWRSVSAGINTLSKVGVGTTAPTSQLTVSGDAIISGVTTLNSSSGVGTVTVGYGNTALFVDGEARIIGILTVGRGSITFDGNNNNITVGSGITITGSTGTIEATSLVTGTITATTFSGDGSSLTGVGNTDNILSNAINVTGVVTATSFEGDGSALTGVGAASTDNILTNAISVSGVSTFTGNVSFGSSALFSDNDKISLGSDNDFDIYFDGSNTYLTNKSTNGASDLYIQSDEILLRRYDGGQTMAQFTEGGSVKLNYAGVTKIQTTSYGAVVSNELVATSLNASGLSTFSNTVVGGATTEMVVGGNLRVTGVTTVGILTSTEPAEIDGIKISGKGSANVFIGQDAGRDHSGASQCVALGWNALAENTNSDFNTAIGLQALGNLGQNTGSSYSRNTAVGHIAGSALATGVSNTLIGASAGNEITSGSNNTLVGRYDGNNSDLDIRTSSNNVVLSDGEGNIRFYANSSGDVGIGTAAPTSKLDIVGDVNVSGVVTATSFSGDGSALTGISAGVTTSHTNVQVAWSVTANGTSAFRFAGPGNDGAEDNPDLYLVRGQRYRFTNNSGGGHPFEIRSSPGGSAFSDGVTNNAAASGNIDFNVQHDAPNRLYYQCTNHAGMLGNIYILRQNAFGNGGFNELDAALFN